MMKSIRKTAARCGFLALAAVGLLLGSSQVASADRYFNSAEPGCDGSDPTYLFCDDFEDGDWIVTNCDTAGGNDNPDNDGWCGNIFVGPDPEGTAFARCASRGQPGGVEGTNCSAAKASTGPSGMMGDHEFRDLTSVDEVYFRYYYYADPNSNWNHEKMITVNRCCSGPGGIDFGGLNAAFGGHSPIFGVTNEDAWKDQNVSAFQLQPGQWHYMELHVKVNTWGQSDGVIELWGDHCGADGLGCTGPGTLRIRHTNVSLKQAPAWQIGLIWLENWSPTGSNGASAPYSSGDRRYDQIIAATRRIGPMSSDGTLPPPPPPPPPPPTGGAPVAPVQLPALPASLLALNASVIGGGATITATYGGAGVGPYHFLFDCGDSGTWDGIRDVAVPTAQYICSFPTGTHAVRVQIWEEVTDTVLQEVLAVTIN